MCLSLEYVYVNAYFRENLSAIQIWERYLYLVAYPTR